MAKFDADILRELREVQEVAIRTEKHPNSAVVIWVVVPPFCISCMANSPIMNS